MFSFLQVIPFETNSEVRWVFISVVFGTDFLPTLKKRWLSGSSSSLKVSSLLNNRPFCYFSVFNDMITIYSPNQKVAISSSYSDLPSMNFIVGLPFIRLIGTSFIAIKVRLWVIPTTVTGTFSTFPKTIASDLSVILIHWFVLYAENATRSTDLQP